MEVKWLGHGADHSPIKSWSIM